MGLLSAQKARIFRGIAKNTPESAKIGALKWSFARRPLASHSLAVARDLEWKASMPRTKKTDPVATDTPSTPPTPRKSRSSSAESEPQAPPKSARPSSRKAKTPTETPNPVEAKASKAPTRKAQATRKSQTADVQPVPAVATEAPAPRTPKPSRAAKSSSVRKSEPTPEVSAPAEPRPKAGLFGKPKAAPTSEPTAPASSPTPAPEINPGPTGRKPRSEAKPPRSQATQTQPETAKPAEPKRGPDRKKTDAKQTARPVLTGDPVLDELPVPIWRPRSAAPAPSANVVEPQPLAGRKGAKRRGRDHIPTVAEAEQLPPKPTRNGRSEPRERPSTPPQTRETEAPREPRPARSTRGKRVLDPTPAPEPVVVRTREPIPVPANAPRVTVINGVPTLTHHRKVYPPLAFFGSSPGERQVQTVLDQVKLAAARGVQIFGHLVELEINRDKVHEAVAVAGYLLKETLALAPESRVFFRVVISAPRDWEKKFPRAKFIAEGGGIAEPSLSDDEFWSEAEDCLTEFVRLLRLVPQNDQVLGLHLERGEWFFADGWGYDTSLAAHEKFRDWVRVRYRDDVVTLRAAWFDGQVQFESVSVPDYTPEVRAGEEFVRTGRKARRWVDYHLFLSDITHDRIVKLAYAVKKASEGWFLVGVSYGYTFEWSHPASGHLSLGKLLRAPEIDFIAGPPSYKNREPGGSSPFPSPIDSFALNGKLYISEEDFKTPISGKQEPDDFNPVMRTPQALESVHWRGAGAALAHRSGICWMDLWGNGWLNSSGIWDRGSKVIDTLLLSLAAPGTDPDVAVFIDERSLSYLVDQRAFTLLVQNVREAVLRSGLSVGFYLLSDLAHRENFPESKVYVFANAWDLRPEVRSAIKNRLQRDNKLLFWLYSAGLFEAGRESLERVREVMGIALRRQPFASKPGTTILQRRHPLGEALPEKSLYGGGSLEPSYFAIPEDGLVIGEYSATGLPSFVHRHFVPVDQPELQWQSVFLGEPIVTPALFRALGQMAGAHVWNYHEDVVHVRAPFLTVHCQGTGLRTITLPDRWSAYNLNAETWSDDGSNQLKFQAIDGSTHVFLVGLRAEIQSLLSLDLDALMELDEVPEIPRNTLDTSLADFDVPIMKLDEWMEESWSEEMEGDFLLKPSQLEFEAEELEPATSGGRRGRRRRRSDDRRGSEEVVTSRREGADSSDPFGDLAMNVVFRKRD